MNDDVKRLSAGLDEAQRQKLGDLEPLADLLAAYSLPTEPGAEEEVRLLAALEQQLPTPAEKAEPEWSIRAWLELAWSQTMVAQAPFGWAGALVLLLGLVAALFRADAILALAFVFLAPILAAGGVAYVFRPETLTLWELERLTPVNPLELLYGRLLVVLLLDTLLALALLGLVWLQGPQLVLWRLLLAWFGPMLALAGVALYVTVRWGQTAGAVAPLGLWGAFTLVGWWQAVERATQLQGAAAWLLGQINNASALPSLCLLAAVWGIFLLWQAGRLVEERAWA
jgi:hypothetical protein